MKPRLSALLPMVVFAIISSVMATLPARAAPIIIAHRGASADLPEHTLEAYALAIAQGADFIEPDLVPTKDGHLVARHENEIGGTTDVATRPEFASRRTVRMIDGQQIEGWFTEDFTLAELKTLFARERLPQLRPGNVAHDGRYRIATLEDVITLVRSETRRLKRTIGIYPETKHPSYFRALGLPVEEPLLAALDANGLNTADAPVFIQSFEVGNLEKLAQRTKVPLIQLMAAEGGPADRPDLTYAAMSTPAGLAAIRGYARGIGVDKAMVMPSAPDGRLAAATALVPNAHAAGLLVHVWTFRPENRFLAAEFRSGGNLADRGNAIGEVQAFINAGIDGIFSDSVVVARAATGVTR